MTTMGMQRKPGVQVRLAAGSPTASRHSHLNPGFKVVFARIDMVEEAFFSARCGRNRPSRFVPAMVARPMEPVREYGFFVDSQGH